MEMGGVFIYLVRGYSCSITKCHVEDSDCVGILPACDGLMLMTWLLSTEGVVRLLI